MAYYPKLSTKTCVYPERTDCNYTDKSGKRCEYMAYDRSRPRGSEPGTWVCTKETPLPPDPPKPPKKVLTAEEKAERKVQLAERRRINAAKEKFGQDTSSADLYICESCGANFLMIKVKPNHCPCCSATPDKLVRIGYEMRMHF